MPRNRSPRWRRFLTFSGTWATRVLSRSAWIGSASGVEHRFYQLSAGLMDIALLGSAGHGLAPIGAHTSSSLTLPDAPRSSDNASCAVTDLGPFSRARESGSDRMPWAPDARCRLGRSDDEDCLGVVVGDVDEVRIGVDGDA